MNFDRHLVPYGPIDWLALFQVNGCSGRKAQPVKYFTAKEFALLDCG